jgi:natural product biosynthesis luciferase-like monooxygenase protein
VRAVELLAALREADIEVWAEEDRLRFRAPPGALTAELRAALAEHRSAVMDLLRRAAAGRRPIVAVPRDGGTVLSYPQRRMWFFEQVRPGTPTYLMAASWRLTGALDVRRLDEAFNALPRRHEILRTGFELRGEEPVQIVRDAATVTLRVVDLAALPEPLRTAEARRLMSTAATEPFDLTRPPLLRAVLVRTGPHEHLLTMTMHHLVSDMWSVGLLLKELVAQYREPSEPPPPAIQYADFAVWQTASGGTDSQLAYWTDLLAGAPALLDLPTDRPRPAQASFAGAQQTRALPVQLTERLDALCRREGVTRFMVLLASYYILLSRLTGEPDLVVGSPIAGRTHAEVEDLLGVFVNTLALRVDLSDDPPFLRLLARVRDLAFGAFEHQDVPVEQLVEVLHPRREPGRSPLFQTMFSLQNNALEPLRLPGLTIETLPFDRRATEFDLVLEVSEEDAGLQASMHYNTDILEAGTVQRLLGHWEALLEGIVEDPARRVGALPMLSTAERRQVLQLCNDTARPHDWVPVHEQVARQAARTPEATAVSFLDRHVSYGALDAAAEALARRLPAAGGAPVAVCVERSPEMIVALLAVLKTGGCYLPIDTTLPPERLQYMIEDARVEVVVTSRAQQSRFAGTAVRTVLVDDADPAAPGRAGPPAPVDGADLAYVIYTSGSTGKPKGVMVEHRGVTNFLVAMDDVIGVADGEPGVWLAVTSVSFDIAVLELLWPLTHGWQVVVQDDGDVLPGARGRAGGARDALDFSLFYFATSSDLGDAQDRYRLLVQGSMFADRHGFSAVWTPERHFASFGGLYPNPSVTAAALSTITERVRLRAGSVVLPLHNPIRVAEDWAVVDNLSGGRVELSFASGWHADDFVLAPDPSVYTRRREAMAEQIGTVQRLWRGEAVTATNGAGRDVEVRVFPRPVQPELPIWLTAAGNPETFRQAGTAGAALLTHLLGQGVEELTGKVALYRQAWRAAGHPGDGHVALMVHTFVGDTAPQTRETVRGPFREYLRSSFGLVQALAPSLGIDGEPTAEDVEALLDVAFDRYYDDAAMMGTVEECAAMADRLRAGGVDEIACLIDFGVPVDDVLAALPKLDEVRRRFAATAATAVPAGTYDVAAQVRRHGVTHLQCTPSLASILVADPGTREALRAVGTLVVGGEALPAPLARDLTGPDGRRVINVYGPTETTIWSTSWPVGDIERGVLIGRPVANTTAYVLDPDGDPVPVGLPGELCLGGLGVARGYLHRPALTAQRFTPSPFADGLRLYRTGDRARLRPDGTLQFLGRIDRQVKLGGHRIELGEIESVLLEHPAVRQAAVVVREEPGGLKDLVAFAVAIGAAPSTTELRAMLLQKLPEVMAPSAVVWLDDLPLNSSGKVDYRALPDPATVQAQQVDRSAVTHGRYVAPKDDVERAIVKVWQDVLKVDRVGTRDSFFELGGHSLMAVQMVSRLRAALHKDLTLRTVFESATVADLADRVRGAGGPATALPALRPVPRTASLPLSFAQQRMWLFDQINHGVTAYHLSAALRITGELHAGALRLAFGALVARHEILRTNFDTVDGVPAQVIGEPGPVPLPRVDLTGLPAAEREPMVHHLAQQETSVPFDLARDRLLRTTLLQTARDEHVLLITTHHIVADSWSLAVIGRELGALYDAYRRGEPSPLPPLPVQYADFAVWQRELLQGPVATQQLDYWRATLADAPPVLDLPTDKARPPVPTYRGAHTTFELGPQMSEALKAMSLAGNVTVFVTLLAAFITVLHRWAGQDRVVLGVPVVGRGVPELEPLIGFLANTTVLHTDLAGDPTFAEVLQRVRDGLIGAYDHQDLPFDKLVADLGIERDLTRNPLFQVMFVYTNDLELAPTLGDLTVSALDVEHGRVFMDLDMSMEDGPGGLRGTLEYSTDLFDAATIEQVLSSFRGVLDAALLDTGTAVSRLPFTVALPGTADPVATADGDALPVVVAATFTAAAVLEPFAFWTDRLGLPVSVRFAPYDQVFQQLLSPHSVMAGNRDGVNVVLLRPADWGGAGGQDALVEEFVQAVTAFQKGRRAPFVVVLCPGPRRVSVVTEGLAKAEGVVCLDMEPLLDRYGVGEHHDAVSDEAGHVPYTAEFFAALGTCLARQTSALAGGYPEVVVVDGGQFDALDGNAAGVLERAVTALAAQGRRVFLSTGAGERAVPGAMVVGGSPPAALDEAARAGGVALADCLYLSSDEANCALVERERPDAPVLRHPADVAALTDFLTHTWLLDPPGVATPGERWWEESAPA